MIVRGLDLFQQMPNEVFLFFGGLTLPQVDEGFVQSVGEIVDGVVGFGEVLLEVFLAEDSRLKV